MRGYVCHTSKKLKDISFLVLIILSEKISSTSPALTPDIPYSNLIFQVINSISLRSTVFFGILSRNRLCPSIVISMSSISISIQFYSGAFKILITCSLSSVLLISVMPLINEIWHCTIAQHSYIHSENYENWKEKNKSKFENTTIGRCKKTPLSSQFYLFRLSMSDKIKLKNLN